MIKVISIVVLICLSQSLSATESQAMLKVPQGARAVALGGAYSTIEQSALASWYNPASISSLQGFDIGFSHLSWIGDTSNELLTLGWGNGNIGVGGFLQYAGTNDMARDINGVDLGQFGVSSMTFGLSASYRISKLRMGINTKMLQQTVNDSTGIGFAVDLGTLASLWNKQLRASVSVLNLGIAAESGELVGISETPMNIRFGLGLYKFSNFNIMSEYRLWTVSQHATISAGTEYFFNTGDIRIALRAGYESGLSAGELAAGLTGGLGLERGNLGLDYAYQSIGNLGSAHTISLNWKLPTKSEPIVTSKAIETPRQNNVEITRAKLNLLFRKALRAYVKKDYSQAAYIFFDISSKSSPNYKIQYYIGMCAWHSGHKKKAIYYIEQSISLKPNQPKLREWLKRAVNTQ